MGREGHWAVGLVGGFGGRLEVHGGWVLHVDQLQAGTVGSRGGRALQNVEVPERKEVH